MNIILKDGKTVVDTFSNQSIVPNIDDRVRLNPTTVFRVERRYIDYIKQEVILEGFKYEKI